MKFLDSSKLQIILAILFVSLGILGTIIFAIGTSMTGIDLTIKEVLSGALGVGFISIILQLLSVGGIIGLILISFLDPFNPPIIFIFIVGMLQVFWSLFLSYLFAFLGKKLFKQTTS